MIWVWGEVLLWFFFCLFVSGGGAGKGMKKKEKTGCCQLSQQAQPGVGRNSEYVL